MKEHTDLKEYTDPTITTLGTVAELTNEGTGAKCLGSGDAHLEGLFPRKESSEVCP